MIKKKNLIFFLTIVLLTNCSFDNKTGIWSGGEDEKGRISDLEKQQKQIIDIERVYSSDSIYSKEISLTKNINLTKPKKNIGWQMQSLNLQNFLGNLYLSGTENIFFKKKIGKNKFDLSKIMNSPLIFEDSILYSDDTGTIFNVSINGKINWKKNLYKKLYKRVYKNLSYIIYDNTIYVADNIGFIYALSFNTGKLLWIKNHGVPLKSNIKIFNDRIYLINQDNRIICLKASDGSKIWDIRSVSSFIKSQGFLSVAISKKGNVLSINSSGDLFKVNGENGSIYWSTNISGSLYEHGTDFFKSTDIVIVNEDIIFSAGSSILSHKINSGRQNWQKEINSASAPIVLGSQIFFVSDNGYFIIMEKDTGEIISSTNILKILKNKKQKTKIVGFIMGSGKIYSVTLNGYLIVSSANSGKVESFKKIGDPIISNPIINNGSLFILTEDSRIIGFN